MKMPFSYCKADFLTGLAVVLPAAVSIGFLTGTQNGEVQAKTRESLVSVFVPTPPLTSGSIVLAPELIFRKMQSLCV
jgi:uncharacterized membrane protein